MYTLWSTLYMLLWSICAYMHVEDEYCRTVGWLVSYTCCRDIHFLWLVSPSTLATREVCHGKLFVNVLQFFAMHIFHGTHHVLQVLNNFIYLLLMMPHPPPPLSSSWCHTLLLLSQFSLHKALVKVKGTPLCLELLHKLLISAVSGICEMKEHR